MNIDEKNKRKHDILLTAVDDYIRTSQPITSGALNLYFKEISSATIRNEMNALESMGYFKQLHTSGGRVPTALAYKEYVNSIIDKAILDDKAIRNVVSNYEEKSISLVSTLFNLAKRLSRATNYPTVLVQHGFKNLTIVRIQIIPLIQKNALLLVETNAGVIDDNIALDGNVDKQVCEDAGTYLTEHFKGQTIGYLLDNINDVCLKAGKQILEFRDLINDVANALAGVIQTRCDVTNENPTKMLEGLNKDEFDEAKSMFEFLKDADKIIDVVKGDELNCTISDDEERSGMIMSAPIKVNGVPIANLALVGPKRVNYMNVAGALKFIVSQVEDLKGD